MKTSRQQILDYIRAHNLVTAVEISHSLGMTQANARHHLGILQEQGVVAVVGKRPAQGKGRSSKIFSLAEFSYGHNLDRLASALLVELRGLSKEQSVNLAKQIAGEVKRSSNLTARLFQAVQHLNRMNYASRWEAHTDGPHVVFSHCPYLEVVNEHPQLCQVDHHLLEILVGIPVKQLAKLAPDHKGSVYCEFLCR
jgi:predicted ArsR family transcriptional regulator